MPGGPARPRPWRSRLGALTFDLFQDRRTHPPWPESLLAVQPDWWDKDSRYRILRELGRGGMGVVYLAYDRDLDRLVSLKRLHGGTHAAETRELLLREARAAAALDHPNISAVHDVGVSSGGVPFMIRAYHAGEALSERLRRGSLAAGEAVRIAAAVARGLESAHHVHVIHRDIKPSNIMLVERGGVKILDFGIAGRPDGETDDPEVLPGTSAYMSPEQRGGESVDHRTDIWSLGAVLYEMLVGERLPRPRIGEEIHQPGARLPGTVGQTIRGDLEAALSRALQTDPAERYASAGEFADALEELAMRAPAAGTGDGRRHPDSGRRWSDGTGTGTGTGRPQRYLAAIMFADLVGYSALMQGDEALAYEVRTRYRSALAEAATDHGGEVVQHYGDGSVTVFRSAVDGVRAALALQAAVRESPSIPLRVGLHVGDVIRDWDGIYGDGVNVAARVEAAAPAGSVLVSGPVVEQIRNQRDLTVVRLGRADLKNIDEPVDLFALVSSAVHVPTSQEVKTRLTEMALVASSLKEPTVPWTAGTAPGPATSPQPPDRRTLAGARPSSGRRVRPAVAVAAALGILAAGVLLARTWGGGAASPPGQSIAVLPLTAIGADVDPLFTDGLHESILTQLSHVSELAVISRTSVLQYRDTDRPIPDIARELGVATILEGSVQRAAGQLRVHIQLIDATRDAHLWSRQYDRAYEVDEIFAIQSDIARNVARELRATLLPQVQAEISAHRTDDVEALERFFRGNIHFESRYDEGRTNQAIAEYEAAVARDPEFGQAYAALARARIWRFWQFGGSVLEKQRARAALDQAIRYTPATVDTRLAQGQYAYRGERDYGTALEHFQAVARALPNEATSALALGAIHRRLGQWEEAAAEFERATRLAPNDQVGTYTAATTYALMRRFGDASRHAERLAQFLAPAAPNGPLIARWEIASAQGDTARLARLLLDTPPDARALRAAFLAGISLYRRQYDIAMGTGAAPWVIPFQEDRPPLIGRAMLAHRAGQVDRARAMADSARQDLEIALEAQREGEDALLSSLHGNLGLAHAILGNAEDALRYGRTGREILPLSRDAYTGRFGVLRLMFIHLILENREDAVRLLTELSLVPSDVTPALLHMDPRFDSLRDLPAFRALTGDASTRSTGE